MGILQQRRRAHGNRRLHSIEESEEVSYQRVGQLSSHKVLQNLLVRCITQSDGIEIILLHELVEEVGTQYHGLRNRDLCMFILVEFRMTLDNIVEEGEATAFATQGTLTDTGEMAVGIELHTVKDSHDTDILHTTILHDRIENDLTVGIDIFEFMPGNVFQESTDREDGTGTKPTAHVVARHMIQHRLTGDLKDIVLQFLQTGYTGHLLLGHWIAEDKVAKTHVFFDKVMEVDIQFRRVLIDEMETLCLGLCTVDGFRRVKNQWHILITSTNLTEEFQTCFRIAFLYMRETPENILHRESGIRDDTQCILVILLIDLHGLLVVRGEHHLRTSTLTLGCRVRIKGLCGESLRLGEDVIIKVRQYRGIETDIILDEQNHLHTRLLDVVLDVHLIFKQFDDRHDQVGVAKPAEDIVEHRHILVLYALGDTVREGRKYHARNGRMCCLYLTCHSKRIVIRITRHTDHEVDICGLQHLIGLLCGRHLRKGGRVTHTELHILVEDFLIHTAIVLKHKCIVGVSHNEHIEDASRHQVDKRHILQIEFVPLLGYFNCFFHHIERKDTTFFEVYHIFRILFVSL